MSAAIRRAVPQDCTTLFGLIAAHARFERSVATLTLSEFRSILANDEPQVTVFLGVRGGDVLGFAALTFDFALWRARRWAHLDCLFVRDDSRGFGLGAAADHARACGADRMEWQTPAWNERAIAFYHQAGAQDTVKVRFTLPPQSQARASTRCIAKGPHPENGSFGS